VIIKKPTSLFRSIIPQSASDRGNISWTISSENPPRALNRFQEIPLAEQIKPLPDKVFDREEYRESLGDFVFSVSRSSKNVSGSSKKQFEVGQILEFDSSITSGLTTTEVPQTIDIQQNTNEIDYASLGLSESEVMDILESGEAAFGGLVSDINSLMSSIEDDKIGINENQKLLNEIIKVKNAAIVSFGGTGNDIVALLEEKETDTQAEIDRLITEVNSLNVSVKQKYDELLQVREVVR
jgi:hypothetical protein